MVIEQILPMNSNEHIVNFIIDLFTEGAEMNIEDMRAFMQKRAKELLKNKGVSDVNQAVVLHAIFVQYLAKRGMKSNKGKGQTMAVVDVSRHVQVCVN